MKSRIKKIVDINRDKIVYVVNESKITYGELWDKSSEIAEFLKRQGHLPVIIYGHKSINMIVSILSCIIAGRTYIPIDIFTPNSRIEKIIKLTNASLVITNEKIEIDDIDCCNLEELNKYKDAISFENNNKYVYMIFTSGSTGVPKGVPISNDNLINFVNWISNLAPLSSYKNVNVLNQASFSFDLSVADLFFSLCNGHTLFGMEKDIQNDTTAIYKFFKDNSINVAVMTPTFIKMCLLNCEFNDKNITSLKCIYFCGEQLEVKTVSKLFDAFPNIRIINAYGPTEATSAVSAILITREMLENNILPVGEINSSATSIFIDDDEIILKGKSVFDGYLGNNKGGYFSDNGINCFKTGDIGYILDNKLFCKGRKDNQIKYKGYRIELNEIEYNINLINGVKDCVVVAKYNEDSIVRMLKAFVICDNKINEDYLKNKLKNLIPNYMMPKVIKIVNEFPINNNGKIDRKKLSEL